MMDLCPDGSAPFVLKKGENLSGKPLSVQPRQMESAPFPFAPTVPTHQFMPLFHLRVGQSALVFRPLQPMSLLQRPVSAKDFAHAFERREHWSWMRFP